MRKLRLFILLSFFLSCGCRTIDNTIGLSPFIEYDCNQKELFVRPLFSAKSGDVKCIWPFFRYTTNEKGTSSWLLPLMIYRSRKQEKGYDKDFYLFPLIATGSSPDEGSYFAFFPFGGRLKSFWGKDTFDFVLFPCYMRLRDRENVSQHVLFPLVNWESGEGKSGYRVWPFWATYSAKTKEGKPKYERRFILWPFLSMQENQLDTSNPSNAWVFFPFYSYSNSTNISETHILWPLYAHKEDKKHKYQSWGMSVVPVRFAKGEDETQLDFWPFCGWWNKPERFRQFCLWPIQRYEHEDTDEIKADRFWILPFYMDANVEWPQAKGKKKILKRRKIWPFFSFEEKNDSMHWETLSLFPWFDETTDRFWGRLFQLARYKRQGKAKAFELLWGLYSWEENQNSDVWRILGGCFSRRKEKDKTVYHILFIPFTTEA